MFNLFFVSGYALLLQMNWKGLIEDYSLKNRKVFHCYFIYLGHQIREIWEFLEELAQFCRERKKERLSVLSTFCNSLNIN